MQPRVELPIAIASAFAEMAQQHATHLSCSQYVRRVVVLVSPQASVPEGFTAAEVCEAMEADAGWVRHSYLEARVAAAKGRLVVCSAGSPPSHVAILLRPTRLHPENNLLVCHVCARPKTVAAFLDDEFPGQPITYYGLREE